MLASLSFATVISGMAAVGAPAARSWRAARTRCTGPRRSRPISRATAAARRLPSCPPPRSLLAHAGGLKHSIFRPAHLSFGRAVKRRPGDEDALSAGQQLICTSPLHRCARNLLNYHFVQRMPNSMEVPGREVSTEEVKEAPFEQIIYWITANRDEFDVPRFRDSLPDAVRDRDDVTVLIASEIELEGQYHALFGWTIGNEEVDLNVEYYAGPLPEIRGEAADAASDPSKSDRDGPPAEHLMGWLGQFFATENVTAHAHARYRYPGQSRAATFDLALMAEPPHGAKLYGVALQLPTKPDGVVSVRLTRGKSDWYAELIGEREISFRDFSPIDEGNRLQAFLGSFLRETTS